MSIMESRNSTKVQKIVRERIKEIAEGNNVVTTKVSLVQVFLNVPNLGNRKSYNFDQRFFGLNVWI